MGTAPDRWRVRLTGPAEADLRRIIRFTRDRFGVEQATAYRRMIMHVLAELTAGPYLVGSRSRDEFLTGLRSVHVARHQRRGRHLAFYRATETGVIEVLRILHDAMDFSRHLPPGR